MSRMARMLLGCAALLTPAVIGCDDDSCPTAPQVGTISIDAEPNSISAPWTLTGPGGFSETSAGDRTLSNMSVGSYTLRWDPVVDWILPTLSVQTQSLEGGRSLLFQASHQHIPEGFVYIAPGTFTMGSPESEPGRFMSETQHEVTLTRGFFMSKYEVTERWWSEVLGAASSTSQLPKAGVSWYSAIAFCNALSLQEGLTPAYTTSPSGGGITWDREANGYRLPTEAEWEFACRAGSTTAFALGGITNAACDPVDPILADSGWYCGNTSGTMPVGQKQPNAWGLFDMHGNVSEWVWDGLAWDYQNLPGTDPVHNVGPDANRVVRGGHWWSEAQVSRSASRDHGHPTSVLIHAGYGFRPVRSVL